MEGFSWQCQFHKNCPIFWFSSALRIALMQSTLGTRLENWFGVKWFSLLSYFKLWLFLWYRLFVLLGCLRGKHEGRSVSSHALSWPYCFHLFYSWENRACLAVFWLLSLHFGLKFLLDKEGELFPQKLFKLRKLWVALKQAWSLPSAHMRENKIFKNFITYNQI